MIQYWKSKSKQWVSQKQSRKNAGHVKCPTDINISGDFGLRLKKRGCSGGYGAWALVQHQTAAEQADSRDCGMYDCLWLYFICVLVCVCSSTANRWTAPAALNDQTLKTVEVVRKDPFIIPCFWGHKDSGPHRNTDKSLCRWLMSTNTQI